MVDIFSDFFMEKASKEGIEVSDRQLEQMRVYFNDLIKWNQIINLTSLKDPEEIIVKHFIDSLLLLKHIDFSSGATIMDVGTGAGFPGLVLKIMRPDLKISLLDSLNKRLKFVRDVVETLSIRNVDILHFRAEIAGKMPLYRERYDYVVARAVAPMQHLLEYCVPFVKIDSGIFIAMKSTQGKQEVEENEEVAKILGAEFGNMIEFNLPNGDYRNLIIYSKVKHTPQKFPRQMGQIRKKILGKVKTTS